MTRSTRRRNLFLASLLAATLVACGSDVGATTTTVAADPTLASTLTGEALATGGPCATEFDPADPFPTRVEPRHSTLWTVDYRDTFVVLSVPNTEFPDRPAIDYVLVPCGAPEPELTDDLADAQIFTVPVGRTVENHNNALAMLEQLDVLATVVGMSDSQLGLADNAYVAGLIDAADDPQNVGDGDAPEFEITLGLEPDLVLEAGYGPGYTNVTDSVDRGLPTVMVSNRVEPTPLGSAEWIKFLSVFYGAEAIANERFAAIEQRYDAVVETIAGRLPADFSAGYLCIEPDNGCEFMYAHGADTLVGTILETLGVTNVFAEGNDAANGQEFDYETALGLAADADFFVDYELPENIVATLAADDRFQNFRPFAAGNYIAYIADDHPFCRFNLTVQVDMLITDIAMGIAPELFPGATPTCFARPG